MAKKNVNPKVIGIRFSDNDFHNTINAFLQILSITGLDAYDNLSKKNIVELFNRSAAGLYWLAQNRLRYQTLDEEGIKKYLVISEKDVFLDKEVSAYIKDHKGWDNGEFHVLDTAVRVFEADRFKPYIYSV